jgi:hypothetical protein
MATAKPRFYIKTRTEKGVEITAKVPVCACKKDPKILGIVRNTNMVGEITLRRQGEPGVCTREVTYSLPSPIDSLPLLWSNISTWLMEQDFSEGIVSVMSKTKRVFEYPDKDPVVWRNPVLVNIILSLLVKWEERRMGTHG